MLSIEFFRWLWACFILRFVKEFCYKCIIRRVIYAASHLDRDVERHAQTSFTIMLLRGGAYVYIGYALQCAEEISAVFNMHCTCLDSGVFRPYPVRPAPTRWPFSSRLVVISCGMYSFTVFLWIGDSFHCAAKLLQSSERLRSVFRVSSVRLLITDACIWIAHRSIISFQISYPIDTNHIHSTTFKCSGTNSGIAWHPTSAFRWSCHPRPSLARASRSRARVAGGVSWRHVQNFIHACLEDGSQIRLA